MTSIFQYSRQNQDEELDNIPSIFQDVKRQKIENIIPPIGIAKPELVEAFQQNMEDEDKIRRLIDETEAYERETPLQTGTREVLSHGVRAGEGFLGGINSFINLLTPELYQNEEGMPYEPGQQPQGLPGPGELREITKHFTGNYLEPKGEKTKATQEIASDIGSMFSTPGLGWVQKMVLPIGGQLTKQVIKSSGGSEKAQDWGKLGFMTLSSIAHLGNAQRVATNAMNQARDMIPRGLSFTARPTQRALQRVRNSDWYRTGRTPSKGPAMDEIDRIEGHIRNGMIDAHTAIQLRQDINEARRQLGGFSLTRPVNRRAALHYLDDVDNALIQSMENYGTHVNPQWYRNYTMANEAYRVTQRSRLVSDFIQQHARPLQSETAKTLFHMGVGAAGVKLPALAAAAVPVAAAAKTVKIMNRMIRSPVLRNHYLDVLRASAQGNAAVMNKALDKFDKEAKRYEYPKKQEEN